jgi:hypothetical protein
MFTKDHDQCAEAMMNVAAHYFGDHANCRKCGALDEDGEPQKRRRAHRLGADSMPVNLLRNKCLSEIVTIKRKGILTIKKKGKRKGFLSLYGDYFGEVLITWKVNRCRICTWVMSGTLECG